MAINSTLSTDGQSNVQSTIIQSAPESSTQVDGIYAKYVLGVLVVVGVLNFIDRQILAILAEEVKADLGLSDSDLGFLFGTAFAVLYAVFGIPLGRLADSWNRTKLISICVGFWSLMTALSGTARSFAPLALCRFGVGIGEAGVTPSAYSMFYDYFSPRFRTTAIAIYSSGSSIGAGIGLFLGGAILSAWNGAWPDPATAPFGLRAWQAALMVVGLPGLLIALWVSTLKEPVHGQVSKTSDTVHPLNSLIKEILPMLPGVNLFVLHSEKASLKERWLNLSVGVTLIIVVALLIKLTDEHLQWIALGIGVYCVVSWVQVLACRDPVCFGQIFRCKSLLYLYLYAGLHTFSASAIGFWMLPFYQRSRGVGVAELGLVVGLSTSIAGLIGMVTGGILADKLRLRVQRGKLYVALVANIIAILMATFMLTVEHLWVIYACGFVWFLGITMAAAPAAATVTDLMIPRIRATAIALFILVGYFAGIALGPYGVGLLSDIFTASGVENSAALRQAMLASLLVPAVGVGFLLLAIKSFIADENSIYERARNLGENIYGDKDSENHKEI